MTHPANWKQSSLTDLLSDTFDGAWGEEAPPDAGVPVIRSTDMRGGRLSFDDVSYRLVPEKTIAKKALHTGDILVNKSSGSSHLVGAVVPFAAPSVNGQSYLCSNFIRCLRPNTAHIEPMYLYFYLLSPYFRDQVFHASRTTSGLRNLNMAEYLGAKVSFPETTEQRRIVDKILEMMERVDEIAELQEEARVEAEYLDTVLFGELELTTTYRRVSIGELISDSQNGRSISKADRDANGAVLTLTAVSDVYLNWSFFKPIQVEVKVAEQFAISEGDVFVSRSNTRALVGLSAVAMQSSPQGTIYPDLLIKLTVDRSLVLPEYLAFALRFPSVRDQIRSHAKGTSQSMVKISGATLREIVVPVPDTISEQERILGILRNRHERAKAIQSSVGEIPANHLRNAILRKAFAGEL